MSELPEGRWIADMDAADRVRLFWDRPGHISHGDRITNDGYSVQSVMLNSSFNALVELVRSQEPPRPTTVQASELLSMDPLPTKVMGRPCLFVGSSLDGVTGQLVGVHVSPVEESSPLARHKMSTYAPTTIVKVEW
jgi:hypothetical protein